jgi:hypothetical protein
MKLHVTGLAFFRARRGQSEALGAALAALGGHNEFTSPCNRIIE